MALHLNTVGPIFIIVRKIWTSTFKAEVAKCNLNKCDYLIKIREISRQYFLSINHESRPPGADDSFTQINVQQLVDEVGGYKRLTRDPYWLRRGYVMELYEI